MLWGVIIEQKTLILRMGSIHMGTKSKQKNSKACYYFPRSCDFFP